MVIFFIIVSVNQALAGYKEIIPLMGNKVYWIVIGTVLVYMATIVLFNGFIIKYLISGRYLQFVSYIIFCAFLYVVVSGSVYALYIDDYDFFSEIEIVDNLSAFVIFILCISGIIIPVFLRYWLRSKQHLNQLKIKQASSQVEQFKEQINPPSFFKILSRSKDFVKTEPEKASAMLMKLGQLLRYQLYDCNRKEVLLTAEISFLRNFLELEKLYSSKFDYTLETEGNVTGIFILPSVLLSYVQSAVNVFDKEKENYIVDVRFSNTDNAVYITLDVLGVGNNALLQKELLKVKERLNALYKDCYELAVTNDKSTQKTEMVLKLDKK